MASSSVAAVPEGLAEFGATTGQGSWCPTRSWPRAPTSGWQVSSVYSSSPSLQSSAPSTAADGEGKATFTAHLDVD